mmetsp:Transcript_25973/g.60010  ORF Transcript_25973/g.60010 Transcript_25973/m.60010 type:complete len:285 (+) Transcript_25973:43-897(+)
MWSITWYHCPGYTKTNFLMLIQFVKKSNDGGRIHDVQCKHTALLSNASPLAAPVWGVGASELSCRSPNPFRLNLAAAPNPPPNAATMRSSVRSRDRFTIKTTFSLSALHPPPATHGRARAYTHTHSHTCTHTHTHTLAHKLTRTLAHTYTYTHILTHTHTLTRTLTRTQQQQQQQQQRQVCHLPLAMRARPRCEVLQVHALARQAGVLPLQELPGALRDGAEQGQLRHARARRRAGAGGAVAHPRRRGGGQRSKRLLQALFPGPLRTELSELQRTGDRGFLLHS